MGNLLHQHFPKAMHIWVPHEPVGIKMAPLPPDHYDRHSIELRDFCERRVMEKAVEAFVEVCRSRDDVVLFTNIDAFMEPGIAEKVALLVETNKIRDRVFVLSPAQLPQSGKGKNILPDLMRTARVFLTMSEMEGFGMAACEAAASGVPVVGTDQIPVLTDIIAPAGGGKVVEAGDASTAARAILDILAMNESDYRDLCTKAYESVIPRFTWRSITETMFNQVESKGFVVNGAKGNGRPSA